jgi:hypothetical protein
MYLMNKFTNIILPNFLEPCYTDDLMRVGKDNDGGYLVSLEDITKSDLLISIGISFDWSFEKRFKAINKEIIIFTYDGSVGFKYFVKNIKYHLKNFLSKPSTIGFSKLTRRIKMLIDFSIFFRFNILKSKIFHEESFVDSNMDSDYLASFSKYYGYDPKTIGKNYMFEKIINNTFLSKDIEGSEYGLLEDIVHYQQYISGMVIEFHDVHENLEKIEFFIRNFKLNLLHLHINNFADVISGLPSVIELTFSKYSEISKDKAALLPHKFDQPNTEKGPSFNVSFAKV